MATHRFQRSAIWTVFAALTLAGCGAEQASTPPAPPPPVAAPATTAPPAAPQPAGPLSAQGKDWQYIVNNATRAADAYAVARNPNASTLGSRQIDFVEQAAGEFAGRHLLKIAVEHGGNTSFFMLLPLFDEDAPSDALDDEGELWRVVVAKHNGADF